MQVTELLNSCTFAARMPADEIGLHHPLSAFRGQMGAVYVFDDVLSAGNTPLSLSASALLMQEHGAMPAGAAPASIHTLPQPPAECFWHAQRVNWLNIAV